MNIIERISSVGGFDIQNLNDGVESTILTKRKGVGVGDIIIHRNQMDLSVFDFKVIIAPDITDPIQRQQICLAFMNSIQNELTVHSELYKTLIDKAINLYQEPQLFATLQTTDQEEMYLFYLLTSSALRVMNNHKDLFPHSGLLH